MEIVFVRTGQRRYRVEAHRDAAADMVMDPAPGYHDHLPHDLVHFFVETHWRLRDGVYGQLAVGGDASTFVPLEPGSRRQLRRSSRKNRLSGGDVRASEHLAALALGAWELRSGRRIEVPDNADHLLAEAGVGPEELDEAASHLDDLARHWHALGVGGSLALEWPWPERRTGRRNRG